MRHGSGDDGRPDRRLCAALAATDGSAAARSQVWAALVDARVFLALTASATGREAGVHGVDQESGAELSLITMSSAGGVRALPAFTDGHEVQRWQPQARPVPLTGPQACQTALDDRAQALLLDPSGAAFVLAGRELIEIAAGRVPVAGAALSARTAMGPPTEPLDDPALARALERALALLAAARAAPPLRAACLLQGPDGPVLGLVPAGTLTAEQVVTLASRLQRELGSALPPGGVDLAVVPESTTGRPLALSVGPVPVDSGAPAAGKRRRWWRRGGP